MYDPDMDFRKLALETHYRARGFRLVTKDDLEAITHIIVGVTYREGFPRDQKKGDYISIEAVVADQATLDLPQCRKMRESRHLGSELTVFPNEPVVYNDSGTGARRTLTELFAWMGLIDCGSLAGFTSLTPYDKPYQLWAAGADLATTGIIADNNGEKFRYGVPRGLRRSDYTVEGVGDATTFYFGKLHR
jgi:hypothetical protein